MSYGRFTKAVSAFLIPLVLCFLVLPNFAAAQGQSELPDACAQARSDAKANVSGMWFFAGCLGATGILIAYLVDPSPPATATMGKPADWVAIYSDCYRSAGKSEQGKKALVGCCVMTAAYVAFYVVLFVIILESEDESDEWQDDGW